MPELPEVEVLRRSLEPHVVGARVDRVQVWRGELREPVDRRRLARWVQGCRIVGVRRRAKYLLLDLGNGRTLVIHLGMSGRVNLVPAASSPVSHEHVGIFLDTGMRLRYRDPRRFGQVFAIRTAAQDQDRHFAHLGLEPLGGRLDGEALRGLACGRRAPIKSFLMDSRVVVGVGNIYASESLYRAGIHPRRSVARISPHRWESLAAAVRATLQAAIALGGTTLNDFTDALGEKGYFRVSVAVYQRQGQPCQRCGATIRRILQSGRSSYYCPTCQR